MDLESRASELARTKAGSPEAWKQALEVVKADAGRARMTLDKLDAILELCASPADLETSFRVVLALHREDGRCEDGWAYYRALVDASDTNLSGWGRAVEAVFEYLSANQKRVAMEDALQYIACTEESPEIKNGKAPLSTAVRHYLDEYGLHAARDI
ncbi:MAG: hypothetical protein ACPGN3_14940 [Opitutales bacterium]